MAVLGSWFLICSSVTSMMRHRARYLFLLLHLFNCSMFFILLLSLGLGDYLLLLACRGSSYSRNRTSSTRMNTQMNMTPKRAEFFRKSQGPGFYGRMSNSPKSSSPWSDSPVKGNYPWCHFYNLYILQ